MVLRYVPPSMAFSWPTESAAPWNVSNRLAVLTNFSIAIPDSLAAACSCINTPIAPLPCSISCGPSVVKSVIIFWVEISSWLARENSWPATFADCWPVIPMLLLRISMVLTDVSASTPIVWRTEPMALTAFWCSGDILVNPDIDEYKDPISAAASCMERPKV